MVAVKDKPKKMRIIASGKRHAKLFKEAKARGNMTLESIAEERFRFWDEAHKSKKGE